MTIDEKVECVAELYFKDDAKKNSILFLLGDDNNIYVPENVDRYLKPFNKAPLKNMYTDDLMLIEYIKQYSIIEEKPWT